MTRHQTGNALIRALNVINTALIENSERRPWNQIVDAARTRLSGKKLTVTVDDDRSETEHQERFLVQLRNDRFCMVSEADSLQTVQSDSSNPQSTAKADWNVTTRFLDDLAFRAKYYIEHPARIGLDWLTDRLGLAGPG